MKAKERFFAEGEHALALFTYQPTGSGVICTRLLFLEKRITEPLFADRGGLSMPRKDSSLVR